MEKYDMFQSPYGDNALRRFQNKYFIGLEVFGMFQSPYGDNALRR